MRNRAKKNVAKKGRRDEFSESPVNKAKTPTGKEVDAEPLEVALTHVALADDYPEWLLSLKGRVPASIDLDF